MKIVVIGSLNVDHMIKLKRLPVSGETIHGLRQFKFPGGKGLNQAAALSRLGNEVQLIGMIGHDDDGNFLQEELNNEKIDSNLIKRCRNIKTGNSFILVDEKGKNIIVVMHGANNELDIKYIDEHKKIISNAEFIILQLEIPVNTNFYIIDQAKKYNVPVVVNPSPFHPLINQQLKKIDYLVLNETEASLLLDNTIKSEIEAVDAINLIQSRGAKNVIITLGEHGAVYIDEHKNKGFQPAYKVSAIDSTAAGDAFIGGLIHQLINKKSLKEAVNFANAAGALAASKLGALSSLPSLETVEDFLSSNKINYF